MGRSPGGEGGGRWATAEFGLRRKNDRAEKRGKGKGILGRVLKQNLSYRPRSCLVAKKKKYKIHTVALSFVFDKYCPTID